MDVAWGGGEMEDLRMQILRFGDFPRARRVPSRQNANFGFAKISISPLFVVIIRGGFCGVYKKGEQLIKKFINSFDKCKISNV